MKKNIFFIILVALAAFSIAAVGAWFSVYGLTKVFPAGILTFILFGSLEFAKLVIVSFVYRFWKITNLLQRIYLIFATVVLMTITSAGIYGFLTSAYQTTANELTIIDSESKIIDSKKEFLVLEKNRYQEEIDSKNNQVNNYISNRTLQENSIVEMLGKGADTNFTSGERWVFRNNANKTQSSLKDTKNQITELRDENGILYIKINVINDSIASLDRQLITMQNTDFSAEIGPLKYLSNLTDQPMDKVVNWLSLLIIFVFDPLAIILIISLNQLMLFSGFDPFVGTKSYKKLKKKEPELKIEPKIQKLEPKIQKLKPNMDGIEKISNINKAQFIPKDQSFHS